MWTRSDYERKHLENTSYFELYVPYVFSKYISGKRILDVGSGQQTRNVPNRPESFTVYSDISLNAMRIAAAKQKESGYFVVFDVGNIPFKDGTFDFIIAKDLLEHLIDDQKCVRSIGRVLRSGGRVGIWTPTILLKRDVERWGHVRAYSHEKLKELFNKIGFRCIHIQANRSWAGRKVYTYVIMHFAKFISLFLHFSIMKSKHYYSMKSLFGVSENEYALYLFERYIDSFVLRIIPNLSTTVIAIFEKSS